MGEREITSIAAFPLLIEFMPGTVLYREAHPGDEAQHELRDDGVDVDGDPGIAEREDEEDHEEETPQNHLSSSPLGSRPVGEIARFSAKAAEVRAWRFKKDAAVDAR